MPRETLSPAQRARIRRGAAPREGAHDAEGGELNVVPFLDILMNVMMFVLATLAVTFTANLEVTPPQPRPRPTSTAELAPSLALHVVVVHEGFFVSAFGKHVAPGCEGEGAGLAVGMTGASHDFAGLTACVKRLKGLGPDPAHERGVVVSASPDVPYQTVIDTVDAVRKSGDVELFPEVSFAVPR